MLPKLISQEQRVLSHFAERKNKSLIKILKGKGPSIESCGIPFSIFVQSLSAEPI